MNKLPQIVIKVKNFGEIKAELYPEKAPKTVENFLRLAAEGFFSGLIFHRVISGFMIQGGGMDANLVPKDTDAIVGEFAANGFPQNDLSHTRGTLSMARTNNPDSASSQFFIMHDDGKYLDGQYAAFGRVIEGLDVVDKIAAVPTRRVRYYDDVPSSPVIIEKVIIVE